MANNRNYATIRSTSEFQSLVPPLVMIADAEIPTAQLLRGVCFPLMGEPVDGGELDGTRYSGQVRQHSAGGFDRADLGRVANQNELATVGGGVGEGGQVGGVQH